MKQSKHPLISIIIPIYNVEKYLRRCLDSVVKQAYRNIEIVLVDDGSPDGCPGICDEFASADERIKVIHKENEGLAEARNVGVSAATGEYISFVDSDDFVSLKYVEILYKGITKFDAAISLATFQRFEKMEDVVPQEVGDADFQLLTKNQVFENYTSLNTCASMPFISACNKLYKRELFDDVQYPKGKLFEDSFTSYKLLDKADKIAFVPDALYYYFINPKSIMGTSFKEKHLEVIEAYRGGCNYFLNKGESEISYMMIVPLLMREAYCWWGCRYILKNKILAKSVLSQYRLESRKLKFVRTLDVKWKAAFKIIACVPWLYALYRKFSPVRIGDR